MDSEEREESGFVILRMLPTYEQTNVKNVCKNPVIARPLFRSLYHASAAYYQVHGVIDLESTYTIVNSHCLLYLYEYNPYHRLRLPHLIP